jgi:hypothetical protein
MPGRSPRSSLLEHSSPLRSSGYIVTDRGRAAIDRQGQQDAVA